MHLTGITPDDIGADDFLRRPIAAFNQMIGADGFDQCEWRVVIEWDDQRDTSQGRQDGETIIQRIDRAIAAFVQTLDRRIRVNADDETAAEQSSFFQVGDMAAMQDIEATVGENQGPGNHREPRR